MAKHFTTNFNKSTNNLLISRFPSKSWYISPNKRPTGFTVWENKWVSGRVVNPGWLLKVYNDFGPTDFQIFPFHCPARFFWNLPSIGRRAFRQFERFE